MSDQTTRTMLAAYISQAAPTMFLSGLFQTPARNIHTSEEVELDIIRSGEDVAVVIQDLSVGSRQNSTDIYTNKSFKPPIYSEEVTLNAFNLIKRQAGQNPFESPNFRFNIVEQMFRGMTEIERKIRRSIEWQSSQVLQTGKLDLIDSSGNTLYALDFKPKSSHFPTVLTAWDAAGGKPLSDIEAACEVNRDDGLEDSNQLIMGAASFNAFIANDTVQKHYDNRRIDQGTISPDAMMGTGGNFRGVVVVGNYKLDIWTYGGRYTNPQSLVKTPFVANNKVIVRASGARMDLTFGAVPNIANIVGVPRLLPELPSRISNAAGGMDMSTHVWMPGDGSALKGSVATRPLTIPTAIDTYSCINTLVA